MNEVIAKIKVLINGEDLLIPHKLTKNSACVDLYAAVGNTFFISSKEVRLIPTGFSMEILVGFEAQIRPRSGLAIKHKLSILNSPIDSNYRGEVGVILFNYSDDSFTVKRGDRIAQMVIKKVEDFEF